MFVPGAKAHESIRGQTDSCIGWVPIHELIAADTGDASEGQLQKVVEQRTQLEMRVLSGTSALSGKCTASGSERDISIAYPSHRTPSSRTERGQSCVD